MVFLSLPRCSWVLLTECLELLITLSWMHFRIPPMMQALRGTTERPNFRVGRDMSPQHLNAFRGSWTPGHLDTWTPDLLELENA